MFEATISVGSAEKLLSLFGARDQHLRLIREAVHVDIFVREGEIHITGEEAPVAQATEIFEGLKALAMRKPVISSEELAGVLSAVTGDGPMADRPEIDVFEASRKIRPRTAGQTRYVNAIEKNDLVFCIGPAGTGKTYLAVAMAVAALRQERVRKIVLVRPAVEAGESLGFLPGDLHAKINPYQRPLLDALQEMIEFEQFKKFTERDVIEVIPLAYMRGRTLNEAFIILDEAQNATVGQMKMFLTRMGAGSKIVVSGDTTQVDLPSKQRSGLTDAMGRLKNIKSVAQVTLHKSDIVRHSLVQQIVAAYEDEPQQRKRKR